MYIFPLSKEETIFTTEILTQKRNDTSVLRNVVMNKGLNQKTHD